MCVCVFWVMFAHTVACVDLVILHLYVSAERIDQTVDIIKHTIGIEEKGIKLRLTIIDTPGFGDAIDNTER